MVTDFLVKEFKRRSKSNPAYSLRAYAKSLSIHSATLSSILNGSRKITPKTATHLFSKLNLSANERSRLVMSLLEEQKAQSLFTVLNKENLEAISSWEHFAILSLLEVDSIKPSLKNVSVYLGISVGVALDALKRLEKLGLISRKGSVWKSKGLQLETSTDLPNAALRKIHRQFINKALYSLDHGELEGRDITGMTMAISKEKLPEAKKRITEFRQNLCAFLEDGRKDEVYRMNIQLYPLKVNQEKKCKT